jgi:DNA-directed RNA polymerase delta subunit
MSLLSRGITKVRKVKLSEVREVEAIRKVELREDSFKLIALANKILEKERSYHLYEIIEKIKKATNVSQDRAEVGVIKMYDAGAIEETLNPDYYYLGGSTPF